jgi:hypothetical protein
VRDIQALRKQIREESKKRDKEITAFKRVAREDVKGKIAAELRYVSWCWGWKSLVTVIETMFSSTSGRRSEHRSNSRSTSRFESRSRSA